MKEKRERIKEQEQKEEERR
jgi:hypothetical protein